MSPRRIALGLGLVLLAGLGAYGLSLATAPLALDTVWAGELDPDEPPPPDPWQLPNLPGLIAFFSALVVALATLREGLRTLWEGVFGPPKPSGRRTRRLT